LKLGETKPRAGRDNDRIEDILEMVTLGKKWLTVRLLDTDVIAIKQHWINIIASKTKREVRIPKLCLAHDPATDQPIKGAKCPYCEVDEAGGNAFYLLNVIVRSIQDTAPSKIRMTSEEKKTGIKDPNSSSFTPVRVMRATSTLMGKIIGLKELNKHKSGGKSKQCDVDDPKYGVDLQIMYDENAKGSDKYKLNMGQHSPLTDEEKGYLIQEISPDIVKRLGLESYAEAKREVGRMEIVGSKEFDGSDAGSDSDADLGKKRSSSKSGSSKSGSSKSGSSSSKSSSSSSRGKKKEEFYGSDSASGSDAGSDSGSDSASDSDAGSDSDSSSKKRSSRRSSSSKSGSSRSSSSKSSSSSKRKAASASSSDSASASDAGSDSASASASDSDAGSDSASASDSSSKKRSSSKSGSSKSGSRSSSSSSKRKAASASASDSDAGSASASDAGSDSASASDSDSSSKKRSSSRSSSSKSGSRSSSSGRGSSSKSSSSKSGSSRSSSSKRKAASGSGSGSDDDIPF
jgi:hypothetical protein